MTKAGTVADGNKVRLYMKNFGEFYNDQVSHASTILLSRTGAASEEKIEKAVAMLREKNPQGHHRDYRLEPADRRTDPEGHGK